MLMYLKISAYSNSCGNFSYDDAVAKEINAVAINSSLKCAKFASCYHRLLKIVYFRHLSNNLQQVSSSPQVGRNVRVPSLTVTYTS